jgi:2'-5' RNA ligase
LVGTRINLSDKNICQYVIVFTVESLEPDSTFERASWPLHITIAPPFYFPGSFESLVSVVGEIAAIHPPFEITIGDDAHLRARQSTTVKLIVYPESLVQLHDELELELSKNSARYKGTQYPFLPHFTLREPSRLSKGQMLRVKTLTIIQLEPNNNESSALVRGHITLRG